MTARDLLLFSAGALRGHRLRTSLSLLGVAIGVASVIVLTSLGEGARTYVTGEFASLGTNLVIVLPGKVETTGMAPIIGGMVHDLTLDDVEALRRRVRSARYVAPLGLGSAVLRFGERSREANVIGTTWEMAHVRDYRMGIGSYIPKVEGEMAPRVCALGATLKKELFGAANPLGEVIRVGDERYRVIGVLGPRGVSLGMNLDEMLHIPITRHLKMYDRRGVFRILIRVRTHEEIPAARLSALAILKERHDDEEDVTILTQDAVISTFGRILSALTAALAGIAAISLSVAGILIMNVMLVSVSERTREIGLLKAVGVSPPQVLAAFLLEAAILSTAGGLAGLLAGYGAARVLVAFYPAFPASPPAWAVVSALAVSVSVGLLFGALPARRAARLDPVAALSRR